MAALTVPGDSVPAVVFTLPEMLCDEFEVRGWKMAGVARRFAGGVACLPGQRRCRPLTEWLLAMC